MHCRLKSLLTMDINGLHTWEEFREETRFFIRTRIRSIVNGEKCQLVRAEAPATGAIASVLGWLGGNK